VNAAPGDPRPTVTWTECMSPCPAMGDAVQTACGGIVQYTPTTPCVLVGGKNVYFCLPICKADFERDPHHCCLTLNASGGCR